MNDAWVRLLCMVLLSTVLWSTKLHAQIAVNIKVADTLVIPGDGYTEPPYEANEKDLSGAWQPVGLPHALARQLVDNADRLESVKPPTVVTWYRMQVPTIAAPLNTPYLYIPRWKTDGRIAVYGRGRLLYQSQSSMLWNGWNIPLWIALPNLTDTNLDYTILIRIERPAFSGGGVSSIWVGGSSDLNWRYRTRYLMQVQLPYMSSAAFLAVGLFSLFVWIKLRSPKEYLLFFYISLASFIRTMHFYVGESVLPISDAWFSWLTINSLYWMVILVYFFLNYLHRRPMLWLNRLISVITLGVGILTLPIFSEFFAAFALSSIVYIALIVIGTLVASVGFYQSHLASSRDGFLLSSWTLFGMVFGSFDWLLQNNYVDIESLYLGPYINIAAFLIFMQIIFRRYISANKEVQQVNESLQMRLQERENELIQSHKRLHEIAHRQTLSDERQRMMQDMHDGMGSSLRTALLAIERGQPDSSMVAEVLKNCIDDLKLAIDSMEPVQADLLLLLATLRFRLNPRLESAGIILSWEINNVPALDWIDPRNALHILRILQEAFTNIIKHTQASKIRLITGVTGNSVFVTIVDNGQGFSVTQGMNSPGKGLGNQIRRAEAIGAEIRWESSAVGTTVTLHLPIVREGQAFKSGDRSA